MVGLRLTDLRLNFHLRAVLNLEEECSKNCFREIQGWHQEFSDGGLTLPTRGPKYRFWSTFYAKNLRQNTPSDRRTKMFRRGAIAPSSPPLAPSLEESPFGHSLKKYRFEATQYLCFRAFLPMTAIHEILQKLVNCQRFNAQWLPFYCPKRDYPSRLLSKSGS